MRSAQGRLAAVAAINTGVTWADLSPGPPRHLRRSTSVEASAPINAHSAESEHVRSARTASVLTRRSDHAPRRQARLSFRASVAESACARVVRAPPTIERRPLSSLIAGVATAAGSRGRNSAHTARHRNSSLGDVVHLTIEVMSLRVRSTDRGALGDRVIRAIRSVTERKRESTVRAPAVFIFRARRRLR